MTTTLDEFEKIKFLPKFYSSLVSDKKIHFKWFVGLESKPPRKRVPRMLVKSCLDALRFMMNKWVRAEEFHVIIWFNKTWSKQNFAEILGS